MADSGWMPPGVRGARALRGTIQGAVRAGRNLDQLMTQVERLYADAGLTLAQNTRDAVARQFAQFSDLEARGRALAHVPGTTPISGSWVSFASLERSMASWAASPRLAVRFRVQGQLGGVQLDRWKTRYISGRAGFPLTVGQLRDELWGWSLATVTEQLVDADFTVSEVAISAY